ELRPAVFGVGLDCRLVLGERQLETHVRIHVTVGDVMRDLAHRPSTFAIGRFQLIGRQALYRGTQRGGSLLNVIDEAGALRFWRRTFEVEFANWISSIDHFASP